MWTIEYHNEDGFVGFLEWYKVTDGRKVFKCDGDSKESAQWLCDVLNQHANTLESINKDEEVSDLNRLQKWLDEQSKSEKASIHTAQMVRYAKMAIAASKIEESKSA